MFQRFVGACLLSATLTLAACGGSAAPAPTTAPAPTAARTNDAAATSAPAAATSAPAATRVPVATSAPAQPSGDTSVAPDVKAASDALKELKSYRSTFGYTLEGEDDQGTARKATFEIKQEIINSSGDEYTAMLMQGDMPGTTIAPGGNRIEIARVGGTNYIVTTDAENKVNCISTNSTDDPSSAVGALTIDSILGSLSKAEVVARGETVNGVVTDHYRFSETGGVAGQGLEKAEGDIWIAQNGGYAVRYTGKGTGTLNVFSTSKPSTITWEFNLTDIDQVSEVAIPEACTQQAAATDLPFPANITEKTSTAGFTTFKSAETPAALAEFFKREFPAAGWEAGASQDLGGMMSLEFQKDGRKVTIQLIPDAQKGDTQVVFVETSY